jgi:hypothetical protein
MDPGLAGTASALIPKETAKREIRSILKCINKFKNIVVLQILPN